MARLLPRNISFGLQLVVQSVLENRGTGSIHINVMREVGRWPRILSGHRVVISRGLLENNSDATVASSRMSLN